MEKLIDDITLVQGFQWWDLIPSFIREDFTIIGMIFVIIDLDDCFSLVGLVYVAHGFFVFFIFLINLLYVAYH